MLGGGQGNRAGEEAVPTPSVFPEGNSGHSQGGGWLRAAVKSGWEVRGWGPRARFESWLPHLRTVWLYMVTGPLRASASPSVKWE